MSRTWDVAVVGLGATGSATLLALARRGLRVIGLDRFSPPHPFGSSHGRSRIIRQAYFESPAYVPLLRFAWERWEALERDAGQKLLEQTGGLMLGPPGSEILTGAEASATLHGLPYERLDTPSLRSRFPAFRVPDGTEGLLEPMAGVLDPEAAIASALNLAARAGAEIRTETPVKSVTPAGTGLRCGTRDGPILAGRVILAAGAWVSQFVPGAIPLAVERQVMFWFRPTEAGLWSPGRTPVFIWEWEPGRLFYGIPDQGEGVKLARHHEGATVGPDEVDRRVAAVEAEEVAGLAGRFLTSLGGTPIDSVACLYTNTPDRHFVIGPAPGDPRVLLASACSGHGFKFASALGEVLADLVADGASRFDLTPFSPTRFGPVA